MEHVRIDEGMKRGPRQELAPRATTSPTPSPQGKLDGIDPRAIVARILDGETSQQIAATLNVTRQGLNWWLRQRSEDDWRDTQIITAIERKEQAQEEIDDATNALSLARGRERLRSAQWDLERLYSRLFGQKQEFTVSHTIPQDVAKEIAGLRQELGVARMGQVAVQQLPEIEVAEEQQVIAKDE